MSDVAFEIHLGGSKTLQIVGPADIVKESTEAIVNAANSSLMGGGGVDGAIHRAGGPAILQECKRIVSSIGRLPAGQAVITTGGRLPAKYVIHTVGPIYRDGRSGEARTLARCYRESLRVADEHGVRSLAFPSISTGAFLYPMSEAAKVAVDAVISGLASATHVRLVRLVAFDPAGVEALVLASQGHTSPTSPGNEKTTP